MGLLSAVACGGKVSDEVSTLDHDAGPAHDGYGKYYSSVSAVSDSCSPPLFVGSVGDQVVIVKSDSRGFGFNIPVCNSAVDATPPYYSCNRWDFSDDAPWNIDLLPYWGAGYCDARISTYSQVLSFDSEEIDVEVKLAFTGFSNCPNIGVYPSGDCTSDRIFHFRWLAACVPGGSISDPQSCVSQAPK